MHSIKRINHYTIHHSHMIGSIILDDGKHDIVDSMVFAAVDVDTHPDIFIDLLGDGRFVVQTISSMEGFTDTLAFIPDVHTMDEAVAHVIKQFGLE